MNICIFGDSITWGACDYERGGWATRLRNYFEERGDTPLGADGSLVDVSVYNLGVSGDNTNDLLARMKSECEAREPDMVIMAIGINDSQYMRSDSERRINIDKFKENLANLYETAKQFTEKVVFVGLTLVDESKTMPIPWDTNKQYDNEGVKQYDGVIREFCADKNVKFIEMIDMLTTKYLEDGLHPNANGHGKMFERIKTEIEASLSA